MGFKNLGFRDLQYLVAVGRCRSISRAAVACSITQPALSERIKRIESTLGVELFERHKRTLGVTPVGETVIRKAQALLDEVHAFDEQLASPNVPLSGPLAVGVIATLGPYLMPYLLPSLSQRCPQLELVLHEGLTKNLLTQLEACSLDVLIAAAPLVSVGLEQRELFTEPFVLAIPHGHVLAKKKSIRASDLCGEDMVLLGDGHCLSGQALDVCPAKRRNNNDRLHATTLETLRHMVAAGAGYTLLPELAVGADPPLRELVTYRRLSGQRCYGRDIVLAWRKSFNRMNDVNLLASIIEDSLPVLPTFSPGQP